MIIPLLCLLADLPMKKLDMLIEAAARLKENEEHYNIVFVGDGVERDSLQQQVNGLGISEQVWFYGACYDEKTNAELIYNADTFAWLLVI